MDGLIPKTVPPAHGDGSETWQGNALRTSLQGFLSIYPSSPLRATSNVD